MKRKLLLIALLVMAMTLLTAIGLAEEEPTPCEHKFTTYVSNNNATCTADGTKTAKCDLGCGATDTVTDAGSALEHAWASQGDGTHQCSRCNTLAACSGGKATCESKPKCSVCGGEYGKATGHHYAQDANGSTHSCTHEGCDKKGIACSGGTATCYRAAVCAVCSSSYGEAAGHDWYQTDSGKYHRCRNCDRPASRCSGGTATCTAGPVCSSCGGTYDDPLDHDWEQDASGSSHSCTRCSEKGIPCSGGTATCANKAKCSACRERYGELAPHDWQQRSGRESHICKNCSKTADCSGGTATCEGKAKCALCGGEYGKALGHDWKQSAVGVSHSCTRCGSNVACSGGDATCQKKAVCDVCHQPYGSLMPHRWKADASGKTHSCSYAGCDAKENCSGGHASCTDGASCTTCGNKYEPATGHDWQQKTGTASHQCANCGSTADCTGGTATCQNKAKCALCGGEYGTVKPHAWKQNADGKTHSCTYAGCDKQNITCAGNAATCTQDGVCTTCGKVYAKAPGHAWKRDASGETHSCTRCDEKGVACSGGKADCQNKAKCSSCGETYGELGGHTEKRVSGYSATCERSGKTAGKKCSVCGIVLKEQTSTPALGHAYGPWEADVNGKHTSRCTRNNCADARRVACTPVVFQLDDAEAAVCPVCGLLELGDLAQALAIIDDANVNIRLTGDLLVRALALPFEAHPETAMIFTICQEQGGRALTWEKEAMFTIDFADETLAACRLFRLETGVDETGAQVKTWVEIPCAWEKDVLRFTAEGDGVYLLISQE